MKAAAATDPACACASFEHLVCAVKPMIMLPPTPAAVDLSGLRVLIADDVSDTGRTLELVRDFFGDHVAEARIAVVYEKTHTDVRADYVWRRTDRWINFPWSTEPPLVDRRASAAHGASLAH